MQHCPLYSALLLDTVLPGKGHIGMCFISLMQWLTGIKEIKSTKEAHEERTALSYPSENTKHVKYKVSIDPLGVCLPVVQSGSCRL